MKLYIYNQESMEVVAIVNGESNEECERKAEDANYYPSDDIAWTYSPAFGSNDGLLENDDAEKFNGLYFETNLLSERNNENCNCRN